MGNLIKSELFKLSKSFSYKILILGAFGIGVLNGTFPLTNNSQETGYFVFTFSLSGTLLHSMLASVFTAIFISSEFTNRTFGKSLFCGYTRLSIFFSKVVMFLIGLFPLLLADVSASTIIVSIGNGFGKESLVEVCRVILIPLLYFLIGSLAMGGFFIFIATSVKNAIWTMGVGIGGSYMLIFIMLILQDASIMKYLFLYQLGQIAFWESISVGIFIGVSVITFTLTIIASAFIFEKMELK